MRFRKPKRVQEIALGRASFDFHGFAGDQGELLRQRFDYRPGAPAVLELTDALLLPNARCLYDPEGRRLEPTKVTYVEPGAPAPLIDEKILKIEQASMPEAVEVPAGLTHIDEPVIFLGELHDHYGHFLTDTLARVWDLTEADRGLKVIFAPQSQQRLEHPLVRELLQLFGIEPERILVPQTPARLSRVICPLAALQQSRIYDVFAEPFRQVAKRALAAGAEPPGRPVYLTRSGLGEALRRLVNEEALEARLEREGYAIVHPERLSIPEQIALFNGEHPVVTPFGSAMHTVLFRIRDDGQRLGALFPEKVPPRFAMVDALKGSRASYVMCMSLQSNLDQPVWSIDVDAAMDGLKQARLV